MDQEKTKDTSIIDLTSITIGDASLTTRTDTVGFFNRMPMYLTLSDPNFVIDPTTGIFYDAQTKEPVAVDEPVVIFRASDPCAIYALAAYADNYMSRGGDLTYAQKLADTIAKFQEYAYLAGFKMKMPK